MSSFYLHNKNTGKSHEINDVLVVGRSEGDLILSDNHFISSRHCQFTVKSGSLYVQDLEAKNPLMVNGSRLKNSEKKNLKVGDKLHIGQELYIISSSSHESSDDSQTRVLNINDLNLESEMTISDYAKRFFLIRPSGALDYIGMCLGVFAFFATFASVYKLADLEIRMLASFSVFITAIIILFLRFIFSLRVIHYFIKSKFIRGFFNFFTYFIASLIFITVAALFTPSMFSNHLDMKKIESRCKKSMKESSCYSALLTSSRGVFKTDPRFFKRSYKNLIEQSELKDSNAKLANDALESLEKNDFKGFKKNLRSLKSFYRSKIKKKRKTKN